MILKNECQPAFPISEEDTDRIDECVNIYTGLTKREYFAAKALQGVLSGRTEYEDITVSDSAARAAVLSADRLIKELEKQTE